MKILVYGLNYSPEVTGIGKYSGEMCEWLAARGHDVRVITAPPYYPCWEIIAPYKNTYKCESINNVKIYRCPLYVPGGRVTTLRRLIHLLSFTLSSFPVLLSNLWWRPIVVINIVPALFTSPSAMVYSKLTGAKLVTHVQDFESDAMFGLGMVNGDFLSRFWSKVERFLLRRSSLVSTISKAMVNNAISKGAKQESTFLFPNWSEISRFTNVTEALKFRDSVNLPNNKKIILYSGNIGKKQGLQLLVDVAEVTKNDNGLHYVICGDGAAKKDLKALVAVKELKNIDFLPLQPCEKLPQLLALADVHLVIQNRGVADAVLPSKLTNILAVGGNAVITTDPDTEMGLLVRNFKGIAFVSKPEDVLALVATIEYALDQPKPNSVAIDYAKQFLEKDSILASFEKRIIEAA